MNNFSIIVALANNRVIGLNNTLPWHLPEDLKRFKALTMGHHIIMGRKTYESLGRLLPGRTTVIVTRNPHYHIDGAQIAHNLETALDIASDDAEPFLIGGAELYKAGLPLANKLYLTEVHADFVGDAHLSEIEMAEWIETARSRHTSQNGLAYSYVEYERI
jgi:dihydrofolate reductase